MLDVLCDLFQRTFRIEEDHPRSWNFQLFEPDDPLSDEQWIHIWFAFLHGLGRRMNLDYEIGRRAIRKGINRGLETAKPCWHACKAR